MSQLKNILSGVLVLLALCAFPGAASAGAWDSAHFFDSPEKTVRTLVVTGNFTSPRLIAELVRKESHTPYLLFPASGDSRIFFNPGGKGPALEILEQDVSRFVEFISPKRIVVLGDIRYVPQRYVNSLGGPKCEIVAIDSDNWLANATTIGNLLDCKSLTEDYLAGIRKLDPAMAKQLEASKGSSASAASPKMERPAQAAAVRPASEMSLMPQGGDDEPVLLVPSGRPGASFSEGSKGR